MASVSELIAQKAALEKQIVEAQREARAEAIARVRALMSEHGLTSADLSNRSVSAKRAGASRKVAAKYRDSATGNTWSGRGLQPKWLKAAISEGRTLADFVIQP